jgi:hypothetical protein
MFQIETALLKFDGVSDGESAEKTSVVKRYYRLCNVVCYNLKLPLGFSMGKFDNVSLALGLNEPGLQFTKRKTCSPICLSTLRTMGSTFTMD